MSKEEVYELFLMANIDGAAPEKDKCCAGMIEECFQFYEVGQNTKGSNPIGCLDVLGAHHCRPFIRQDLVLRFKRGIEIVWNNIRCPTRVHSRSTQLCLSSNRLRFTRGGL